MIKQITKNMLSRRKVKRPAKKGSIPINEIKKAVSSVSSGYLIINPDYTLQHSKILTGAMATRARRGELSIVRLRDLKGMNTIGYDGGEWSDIPVRAA